MDDRDDERDGSDERDQPQGPGAEVGMPRWVKVLIAVGVALVALFLVLQVAGGGGHGPRRHGSGADDTSEPVPVDAGGHVPPERHRPSP